MTTKYKLVQVEPTKEMRASGANVHWAQESKFIQDGIYALRTESVTEIYQAMLAAVPEPKGGTPETNSLIAENPDSCSLDDMTLCFNTMLQHARKLELERNTLLARLNELSGDGVA